MTTRAAPSGTQEDEIFLCHGDDSVLRAPTSPSSSSPGGSSGVEAAENAGSTFELDAWIRDEPMECLMDLPEVQLQAPCTDSGAGAGGTMQDGSDAMFLEQLGSQALDMGDVFDDRQQQQQQQEGQQGLPPLVDAKSPSLLPDLRKIIVKKPIMDKAVERLGGGRKGAMRLWSIIQVWLRQQQQQQQPQQGHQTLALPFHGNEMFQQLGQASSVLEADEQSSLLYASAFGGRQQHQMLASQQHEHYACYTGDAHHFYNVPAAYTATTATATATGDGCPRSPAATTRAARKSRMARQRRHTARASAASSSWHPSSPQVPQAAAGTREATSSLYNGNTCHDGKDKSVKFLLQKELKPSDVGNLGRIVLPKKEAELHLPYLSLREGITIAMEDMISSHLWHFRYRFWPNNKSRMYLLESTGDYVKTHCLKEGDVLQLYKDTRTGTHMICCKKVTKTNQAQAKLEEDNVSGVSSISDCQEQVRALESTVSSIQVEEDSRPRPRPSGAATGDGLEQFPSLDVGDEFIEEIMSLVGDSADEDSS